MSFLTSVCLSALAWPSSSIVAPPAQDPLLAAVPKEALVCVSVRDIDGLRASWEENAWHKFYADEAFAPLREQIKKLTEDASKEADFSLDEAFDALHGSMVGFMTVSPSSESEPQFGYLIDPGSSNEKARALFKKALAAPALQHGARTETYKGVELHFAATESHSGVPAATEMEDDTTGTAVKTPTSVKTATDGDPIVLFDTGHVFGFLFGAKAQDLTPSIHALIDRMQGKDANASLASSTRFTDARRGVSSPGRIELYADVRNIYDAAMRDGKPDAEGKKAIELLGLEQLTWAYLTADIGAGEKARIEGGFHLPEKGYLRSFFECLGRSPRELARNMPKEASNIGLSAIDLNKLWTTAWSFVKEIDPKAHDEARGQLTAVSGMFGDVEHDLLLQMTGRFGTFSVAVPSEEWLNSGPGKSFGGQTPEGTLYGDAYVIELNDSTAFSAALTKVLTATQIAPTLHTEEFEGTTITTLSGDDAPTTLQWAFRPKLVIASMYPTALRAALRATAGDAKNTALENASFKPHLDSYADASMLGLANTRDSVRSGMNAFSALRLVTMMSLGAGMLPELPGGDVADRYFKGTIVSAIRRTNDTLKLEISMR